MKPEPISTRAFINTINKSVVIEFNDGSNMRIWNYSKNLKTDVYMKISRIYSYMKDVDFNKEYLWHKYKVINPNVMTCSNSREIYIITEKDSKPDKLSKEFNYQESLYSKIKPEWLSMGHTDNEYGTPIFRQIPFALEGIKRSEIKRKWIYVDCGEPLGVKLMYI